MLFRYSQQPRVWAHLVLPLVLLSSVALAPAQPPERPGESEPVALTPAQVETLLGGRTRISLHLENAPMDAALGAAQRETGVPWRLALRTLPRGPLTLDIKEQPVWSLYDTLRANVEYNRLAPVGVLGNDAVPLSPSESFETVRSSDLGMLQVRIGVGRLGKKHWVVPVRIFVDPKLDIVGGTSRLRMLEARDENDLNLLGADVTTSWYRQYPLMWSSSIAQERLENMGTRLKKLSGVLDCLVSLRKERWEIPLKDAVFPMVKKWTRSDSSETLSVDSVEKIGDGVYQVQVTRLRHSMIHSRFWKSSEMRRLEAFNSGLLTGLKLVDEQGIALTLQKNTLRSDIDESLVSRTVIATFGRGPISERKVLDGQPVGGETPGEPVRLIWSISLDTRPVQVPFTFEDVPLVAT